MFSEEFGNHSFGYSYLLIWLFYLQANRTSPRQSQVPTRTVSAGVFYQRPGGQTAQSPALPASVPQEPADLNHLLRLPCSQPCLHSQGVGSVWATVMKHIILCPHKWHAQCWAAKKQREREGRNPFCQLLRRGCDPSVGKLGMFPNGVKATCTYICIYRLDFPSSAQMGPNRS